MHSILQTLFSFFTCVELVLLLCCIEVHPGAGEENGRTKCSQTKFGAEQWQGGIATFASM